MSILNALAHLLGLVPRKAERNVDISHKVGLKPLPHWVDIWNET